MSIFQDFCAKTSFLEQHQSQYSSDQLGTHVHIINEENDDISGLDVVIIGIGEQRGAKKVATSTAPDDVRAALYDLYYWHTDIKIGDAGNLILGNNLFDSYQALVTTLFELHEAGKKVIIIGGSHDLTFAQYKAYAKAQKLATGVIVDSKINIAEEEQITDQSFLYNIISDANNYLKHLSIIGFQSYLVNPKYLQTLDKLRFDCHRLGEVRSELEYYEAEFRNANFVSMDVAALRGPELPFMTNLSPNGLNADELCQLATYAGLSQVCDSLGIYGYESGNDHQKIGAKVVAQVIWYYLNGLYINVEEPPFTSFNQMETHIVTCDTESLTFKKSIKSNRWWVQAKNEEWIPCSFLDYVHASQQHLPERWLRANERNV